MQVLILCPTRELAVQVSEEVHKLAFFKRGIHALPIYGGQSYERQFYGLQAGRADRHRHAGPRHGSHAPRHACGSTTVKMVILDEVDVMLNMGFRDDIELILQATPEGAADGFLLRHHPAADPGADRKIRARPADRCASSKRR